MKILSSLLLALFLAVPLQVEAFGIESLEHHAVASPGETVTFEFTAINPYERDITLSAHNFKVTDFPRTETHQTLHRYKNYSLHSWIELEDEIHVAAGENRVVPVSVKIPEDQKPGIYTGALSLRENDVLFTPNIPISFIVTVRGEDSLLGSMSFFGLLLYTLPLIALGFYKYIPQPLRK